MWTTVHIIQDLYDRTHKFKYCASLFLIIDLFPNALV